MIILESEQATLGQVAASWVWLSGIIEKLPSSKTYKNSTEILVNCPTSKHQIWQNWHVDFSQSHQTQQLQKGCGHLWVIYIQNIVTAYHQQNGTNNMVYERKSFINKFKKTKGSLNIYNKLNDDINDDDVSDEDNMDVDELMNDLGEISARIIDIDDINVFESNNNSEPPTLLEIFNGQFNPQLIETAIVKGLDFIL
ncbi:unnamed protein product [Rhizophagus irregularis]|nr:unnamed protein product [Rhizophagus irregularis]